MYELLRKISKEVCLSKCPHSLVDCPEKCEFQSLLIKLVAELDRS